MVNIIMTNALMPVLERYQPQLLTYFKSLLKTENLSHAYLFAGSLISWEMAIWLTQSRFCQQKTEGLPCGQCRFCRLIATENFADMMVVEPVNGVIKTEAIRKLVKQFSHSSYEGKEQVVIIKEAEKMHVNAANSLLKVIEEPQTSIRILFLVTELHRILPTIVSRCQVFSLRPNKQAVIEDLEKAGALPQEALILADSITSYTDIAQFEQDKSIQEDITLLEQLVNHYLENHPLVYLEVSRVAKVLADKSRQERSFSILMSIAARELPKAKALALLESIRLARKMWQQHVNYQNALEYLVLSEKTSL